MRPDTATVLPTILFGAFDRHNFGDLLFAHVLARMLPGRRLLFAGLAERDLRAYGGHRVQALRDLSRALAGQAADLIHVGGELLTCDAWEAAVMLAPPDAPQQAIAAQTDWQRDRLAWSRARFGFPSLAPYTVARDAFTPAARVFYHAVGGADLDTRDPALRAEVLARLAAADHVSVRDRQTQAVLRAVGVEATLVPDPAVMVAELFRARIRRRAASGLLDGIPRRYIAAQFSADFGDDATLDRIAAQLDEIAIPSGLGVVFFRAGAAPWHDDLECYRRVRARMRAPAALIFTSPNVWDICALIAGSSVYCGSSLHGRIVAMAFARPRVNVRQSPQTHTPTKHGAFAATWEDPDMRAVVDVPHVADGIRDALSADPARLQRIADTLVVRYREGFASIPEKLC